MSYNFFYKGMKVENIKIYKSDKNWFKKQYWYIHSIRIKEDDRDGTRQGNCLIFIVDPLYRLELSIKLRLKKEKKREKRKY